MKKMIMLLAGIIAVASVNAAAVDWSVTGTTATKGYTVYLTTAIADKYDTFADFSANVVSSADLTGSRTITTGQVAAKPVTAEQAKSLYYVIFEDNNTTDPATFHYIEKDLSAYVYDPNNQETSKGFLSGMTAANILAGTSGTIGGNPPGPIVPEPTSGLLLLVGMAGLALRRKQK